MPQGYVALDIKKYLHRQKQVLNVQQIPEKHSPFDYDIIGSSHQILHVMVILAGLVHMDGLLRAFRFSHGQGALCH